jgi:hypothetical protein
MAEKHNLSNGAIYRKTFIFSWLRLLVDLICIIVLIASGALGFLISGQQILGLGIGVIVGIVIFALIAHFITYMLKAAQIAMMTKGVTEDALPDNVYQAGKAEVRENFISVAAYYAITSLISGIFGQITRAINTIGSVGGGNGVADTISTVIQVLVSYLEDCCLGWVFLKHAQQNAFKSTCEGAVLFFKNWKALLKNMGRIFGMGALSFLVIGGALTLLFHQIIWLFPNFVNEVVASAHFTINDAEISDPTVIVWIASVILAIILWAVLHATFVRPFVLVGVLRNYIAAGLANPPQEESFAKLDSMSSKFAKAHAKAVS